MNEDHAHAAAYTRADFARWGTAAAIERGADGLDRCRVALALDRYTRPWPAGHARPGYPLEEVLLGQRIVLDRVAAELLVHRRLDVPAGRRVFTFTTTRLERPCSTSC